MENIIKMDKLKNAPEVIYKINKKSFTFLFLKLLNDLIKRWRKYLI